MSKQTNSADTSAQIAWQQHPVYPRCLVTAADTTMSLLTVDEDGYGAFLNEDHCALAARAVNAHDGLVRAATRLVGVACGGRLEFATIEEAQQAVLNEMMAALAKATK